MKEILGGTAAILIVICTAAIYHRLVWTLCGYIIEFFRRIRQYTTKN